MELRNLEIFFVSTIVVCTTSTIDDGVSKKTEDVILTLFEEMSEDIKKFEAKADAILPLLT